MTKQSGLKHNPVQSFFEQLDLFLSGIIKGTPLNRKGKEEIPTRPPVIQESPPSEKVKEPTRKLMVCLGAQMVPYELVRNPRRKYLAIEISLEGDLVVLAPQNVSVEYIEQVLRTKSDWVLEIIKKQGHRKWEKPIYESDWDSIRDDAILIDDDWVPLVFERSARRRTVSIGIRNGTILVLVPIRQSIKEVKSWVIRQRPWLEKQYRKHKQVSEKRLDIREKFLKDLRISLLGKDFEIVKNLGKGPDRIKDDQIQLFFNHDDIGDEKVFESKLANVLKKLARPTLQMRLDSILKQLPTVSHKYRKMRLSSAKTRWGSCSSLGDISLNWRLIMLDEDLVKYVICHELAHLTQMNHSKNFWALVENYYPGYKEAEKRLKAISLKDFPLG